MNKKVSVITPCYNSENTIDRSIESVFNQHYENTELIVVNDGSTDSSEEKILAWKEKFEQNNMELKYIYQENKGLGGAINTGLKSVTGEFLMLLDADDEFLDGAISKRIEYLDKHPNCNVVRSNGWIVRGDQKFLFVYEDKEKTNKDVFSMLLRAETNNWAGSYMIRTWVLFDFYKDREIFTSRSGQNLQMLLPVTYKNESGFIDEPLMNYIQQENSLSQIKSSPQEELKRKLENADGYKEIREYLVDKIIEDSAEKAEASKLINQGYWHLILALALEYKQSELADKAVENLKKLEYFGESEKIMYYNFKNPTKAIFIRAVSKIKRMIK